MFFWKRYRPNPDGLLDIAGDLASTDTRAQRRALNELRKDRYAREAVCLAVLAFRAADEQIAAGTFEGNAVQLETFRPIADIVARVSELRSVGDARARDAAAAVLSLLQDGLRSLVAGPSPAPQN